MLQSSKPDYPDHSRVMEFRDDNGNLQPVRTKEDWAKRREHILAGMQDVMGPLPMERCSLDIRTHKSDDAGAYIRNKIDYQADVGDRVPAYLLVPKRIDGKAPAMICLHQTTQMGKDEPAGLGGKPSLHYAHELANRGYICLVPDYPTLGEYTYDFDKDKYTSGTMKGIWNHIRGMDLLCEQPQVDAGRIGSIGHSLGGHNTMFLAAFDPRVKAMVSCCGFTRFCRYYNGDITGWSGPRYMPKILSYGGCAKVPFDFPEIVASFAPRAFLAVAPMRDSNFDIRGVRESMDLAREVYKLMNTEERLAGRYPDAQHDFPDAERTAAYAFLDRQLNSQSN